MTKLVQNTWCHRCIQKKIYDDDAVDEDVDDDDDDVNDMMAMMS